MVNIPRVKLGGISPTVGKSVWRQKLHLLSKIATARPFPHPETPDLMTNRSKGRVGGLAERVHSEPSPSNSLNANEANPATYNG